MLVAALLALVPLVQDVHQDKANQPPLLSVDSIDFHQYVPRHTNPYELCETAQGLIGRDFFVAERGGRHARPVQNLSVLGNAVLVYDEEGYAQRVLKLLDELDAKAEPHETATVPALETLEFRPRYVSLETVLPMLDPFIRKVSTIASDGTSVLIRNAAISDDGGMLILRDYPDELRQVRSLLERIDVPAPQVTITCYLIRAVNDGTGDDLPSELVSGLARLLPDKTFRSTAFSMLRASVGRERSLSLHMQADDGNYALSFTPVAFNPKDATLTVAGCSLMRQDTRLFTTDTLFQGGEYTVLGATGREPVFLVVHVSAH